MAVKQQAFKFIGMQLDLDMSVLNQSTEGGQYLFSAKNIRFITDEANSLYAITNERGTKRVTITGDVPSNKEIPIGTAVLEDELILFTVNSDTHKNYIYDIAWDLENETLNSLKLYGGDLGMTVDHPLDTKVSVDTELKKKVYWIDGVHCLRVINVAELKLNLELRNYILSISDTTIFDSVKTDYIPNSSISIKKTYGAGSFPSGTLLYIVTYIDFNGVETAPVYVSSLYYTSPTSDRAGEKDEICKNTFTIDIKNLPLSSYYKFVRVYSITKTTRAENGLGRLVKEFLLKDAEIEKVGITDFRRVRVVDLNEGEEFDTSSLSYLGSLYIMPNTFEIKDNAMFFGNYNLSSIEKLDTKDPDTDKTLGEELSDFVIPSSKIYYKNNQLDYSTNQITSFKTNQHYRLGIVFTDALNNQSDIVYVGDHVNTNYLISNGIPLCLFILNKNLDLAAFNAIVNKIKEGNWKYATPVVVYPREDDKEVVCQGYLNPTVYNPINRKANIIAHSSWLFRFIPPRSYGNDADKDNCDIIVPEFRHNRIINNVCKYNINSYVVHRYAGADNTASLEYHITNFKVLNIKGLEFSSYPIADYRHVWTGDNYSNLPANLFWQWTNLKEPDFEAHNYDGNEKGFGFILPSNIWESYFFWPDTRKLAYAGSIEDARFRRSRLKQWNTASSNIGYRWTYLGIDSDDRFLDENILGYIPASPYNIDFYYSEDISDELYDKLGGRKNFYITDNNIVTLNSPDTELSENLYNFTNIGDIRYVGALNIKEVTTTKSLIAESLTAFNSFTEENIVINDYQLTFPRMFNINYGTSTCEAFVAGYHTLLRDNTDYNIYHNFTIAPIHSLKMNFNLNMTNALAINDKAKRGVFNPFTDTSGDGDTDDSKGTGGVLVSAVATSIKNNRLSHYFNCDSIFFSNQLMQLYSSVIYAGEDPSLIFKFSNKENLYEPSISKTIVLDSYLATCIYNDDVAIAYEYQTDSPNVPKYDKYYVKINPEGNILPIDYWSGKHLVLQLPSTDGKWLLPTLGDWEEAPSPITQPTIYNPVASYVDDTNKVSDSIGILNYNWYINNVTAYGEQLHQPIIKLPTALNTNDYGIVWLAELTKKVNNQYGGTSQEALINNRWERAGYTVLVNNLDLLKWSEGDCFYGTFRSLKACQADENKVNNVTDVIEFRCESWVNPNSVTSKLKNLKDVTTRNKDNFNLYNDIYSTHTSYKPYFNLTEDDFKSNSFPKQVTVTNSKLINDTVDEWTHITVASVIDMFNDSHAISKLCNFGDQLYVFQDHNIDTILYGTNVMISTESNTPIELGKSSKVEGSNKVANFGCLNKQAIAYTNNAVYFIETETGQLYLLALLPSNVTLAKGMSTWFATNKHSINDTWIPNSQDNFKLLFDKLNEELTITDKDDCLALNDKINLTFSSFYDYNNIPYYEVISNHNVMIDLNCGLWFKNEGEYNSFFGDPQPYYIEFIANAEYPSYKTFTTINYTGDEFEYNGADWKLHGGNDNCGLFDKITVRDEYQETTLAVSLVNSRHLPSSLKEKFRLWGINIPRASQTSINTGRRNRFSNPWIKIKLSKDLKSNIKIKLHNLIVNYLS